MKRLGLIVVSILFCISIKAQSVGLVMSGGGAKGLAHIGVIKALEENSIPIDYITGTSMGSIIGALYSIGYTAEDMVDLFHSKEFYMWLNGKTDISLKYFFMEDDPNAEWFRLRLNKDTVFKAYLPTGIISSYQMDFAFMQLMGRGEAASKYNFDSLMVPFRCAASDIYAKKSVIFKDGNLSKAVRSSMAIPFYFKPVKYEQGLLYDGGIYNNFPIDAMEKDFNPDYIIGVQVSDNNENPAEDDLVMQIFNMTMDRSNYTIPNGKGIMIIPDVLSASTLDFSKCDELIMKGYIAAMEQMPLLIKAINRRVDSTQVNQKREEFKAKMPPMYFDNVEINGLKKAHSKYVSGLFKHWNHDPKSLDVTRKDFYKLIADNTLDKIYPTSKYDQLTGYYTLKLDVSRSKNISAKVGGNISTAATSQAFIELEHLFFGQIPIKLFANGYFGRFYTSGKVAMKSFLTYPTLCYLEAALQLNRWNYMEADPDILFIDTRNPVSIKHNGEFYANLGLPVFMSGKLYSGPAIGVYSQQYYLNKDFLSNDKLDKSILEYGGMHITYERQTLNDKMYPSKGVQFLAKIKYTNLNEKFSQGTSAEQLITTNNKGKSFYDFVLDYSNYNLRAGKFSFPFSVELNLSHHDTLCNTMADMLTTNAYRPTAYTKTVIFEDYRAEKYLAGSLGFMYTIGENCHFQLEGFAFQPYRKKFLEINENGDYIAKSKKDFDGFQYFFNTTLFYNTMIGPVAFNLRYMPEGKSHFYFMFNIGYMIYNKSWWDRN
ncbi:MAG: patatin-like phospholipase family protein [Bacteroidales bacterium]|nr:patatin-like phospholipase family protein [Bacteroidales bacterium]